MKFNEVQLLKPEDWTDTDKSDSVITTHPFFYFKQPNMKYVKKITTFKNNTIYKIPNEYRDNFVDFVAVDNKSKLANMYMTGTTEKRGRFYVYQNIELSGRTESNIKAYEFYRVILINMPIIFVANIHSYGGMRTWQELSKYPDIEVFGWSKGEWINIDPLDSEETHVVDPDLGEPKLNPDLKKIKNMRMIAHKKIGNRGA